jgi:urea transport system substrate-binding protein
MLEHLGKRVYFIGSDYVFPHYVNDITKELVKKNGGTVVGEKYAPLGTSEFSSQIAEIKRAKPDVVFIDVVGTDGVALVKQISQFGLREQVEITGIPTFAGEVLPGIAPVAQGVYTVERYMDKVDNPVSKAFVAEYHKRFGTDAPVSTIAAQGAYGSLLMLKAAAEKAGSTDGDAIADALPGIKVESPAGEIEMNPDNHIVTGPMRLLKIKGNNFDLVEDFGQIPAVGQSGCSSKDV